MEEEKQNKDSSEEVYCLVFKHKIHCSQLEGTEASGLPEERRYEFCLNKCPIYKKGRKGNINKYGQIEIVYKDRALKITKCLTEKGNKYKIEMTDGRFCTSREEYFTNDEQAIERAKQEFSKFV